MVGVEIPRRDADVITCSHIAVFSVPIDVFVLGSDNGLWRNTYNGGWSGWQAAGGT